MVLNNISVAISKAATKNTVILAVATFVLVALTVDTSLIKISILTTSQSGSSERVDFFIVILFISLL